MSRLLLRFSCEKIWPFGEWFREGDRLMHARKGCCSVDLSYADGLMSQNVSLEIAARAQQKAARCFSTRQSTAPRGPLSFLSLGLTVATGIGCLYGYEWMKERKFQEMANSRTEYAGKAAIGGTFTLTDHDGQPFSSDQLKGEFSILYFGFTQCPDICPDELDKITEAVRKIEQRTKTRLKTIFITLDPERDNPKLVKSYVKEFDDDLIGLTGSRADVNKAARTFRVYHSKANEYGNDYLIDHSIITYLLDPEAEFLTFYGKNSTAEELTDSIVGHMKEWAEKNAEYKKQHQTLK